MVHTVGVVYAAPIILVEVVILGMAVRGDASRRDYLLSVTAALTGIAIAIFVAALPWGNLGLAYVAAALFVLAFPLCLALGAERYVRLRRDPLGLLTPTSYGQQRQHRRRRLICKRS